MIPSDHMEVGGVVSGVIAGYNFSEIRNLKYLDLLFYKNVPLIPFPCAYFFSEKHSVVLGTVLTSHTLWTFLRSRLQRDNPTVILILFVLFTNLAFTAIVLPINCVALFRWVGIIIIYLHFQMGFLCFSDLNSCRIIHTFAQYLRSCISGCMGPFCVPRVQLLLTDGLWSAHQNISTADKKSRALLYLSRPLMAFISDLQKRQVC